jgi:hypothetical protein
MCALTRHRGRQCGQEGDRQTPMRRKPHSFEKFTAKPPERDRPLLCEMLISQNSLGQRYERPMNQVTLGTGRILPHRPS